MSIVMGLDQHRAQITAEWIDTSTGDISAIPEGRWTTYGDVADAAGNRDAARSIGDWLWRSGGSKRAIGSRTRVSRSRASAQAIDAATQLRNGVRLAGHPVLTLWRNDIWPRSRRTSSAGSPSCPVGSRTFGR